MQVICGLFLVNGKLSGIEGADFTAPVRISFRDRYGGHGMSFMIEYRFPYLCYTVIKDCWWDISNAEWCQLDQDGLNNVHTFIYAHHLDPKKWRHPSCFACLSNESLQTAARSRLKAEEVLTGFVYFVPFNWRLSCDLLCLWYGWYQTWTLPFLQNRRTWYEVFWYSPLTPGHLLFDIRCPFR